MSQIGEQNLVKGVRLLQDSIRHLEAVLRTAMAEIEVGGSHQDG